MSVVQKKQTRSSRLKELRTIFSGISYGINNTSISYSSYQAFLDKNASPFVLCFDNRFLVNRTTSYGTVQFTQVTTTITRNNPDRFPLSSVSDQWNCQGYRAPWIIRGFNGVNDIDVGTGYLFSALRNQSFCDTGDGVGMGPGIFAVFQTASQINSLNNPKNNGGFGSVSKFILDYSTANSRSPQNLLPKLVFDEDIFYVEPKNSPFTVSSSSISITRSSSEGLDVNVRDIIRNLVTNNSNIPLENFNFTGTSSDPSVATSPSFYTPWIIRYVSSGNFVLTVTQLFFQSVKDNVIYLEGSPFNINVSLTISP